MNQRGNVWRGSGCQTFVDCVDITSILHFVCRKELQYKFEDVLIKARNISNIIFFFYNMQDI